MIDYVAILTRRFFGKEWTLNGDDYAGLTWLSDDTKPTQKTLDEMWASVETEIANETTAKAASKQAILDRLGITADEIVLLLN